MTESVVLSTPRPHVALLFLDHPPLNLLDWEMLNSIDAGITQVEEWLDLRVLVLTGAGRAFSAGADLNVESGEADHGSGFATEAERIFARLEALRVPVIGAVNGHAYGGGLELALSCDILISSDRAKFCCSGVNVGLIANWWRLVRLIGLGPAKHALLTGRPFDAASAERMGLVTSVIAHDELLDAALDEAELVASKAPLSVEAAKSSANVALGLAYADGMALQRKEFADLSMTEDHVEARTAFQARRTPTYHRR